MRKLLLFSLSLLFAVTAFAQNNVQPTTKAISFTPKAPFLAKATTNTNCGQDTVDLAISKATGLAALSINNATSGQAISQYFNAAQAITVSGLDFYAYKIDATGGTSINVTVELYLAGADSTPTGAALASMTVPVDTSFGGGNLNVLRKSAVFTNPVTVSQPYVLVIGNYSPNGIGLVCNSYTAGDGAQDWLSSIDLGGTWVRSYNINVGGPVLDADFVLEPYVTYDLTSDFNYTPTSPCGPTTVSFTDNSSPVLEDPMYNVAAFIGSPEFSFSYDFGDGSPIAYAIDTNYTYATNPPYTVIQYDTLYGWRTTCVVSDTQTVGDAPLVLSTSSTNATCTNGTGTASVTPTGGSGSYTYIWSNAATTASLNNLVAGDYYVTVTDANGCSETETVTVGSTSITISASNTTTNSACGSATGSASVNPTNGTAPYTYLWSDNQSTQTAINLAAGSYDVTITDANGCTGVVSGIMVNNPNSPTAAAAVSSNFNGEDISCNGSSDGEATASATGGTPPYAYSWTNGQTTMVATGLTAGTYSVTITDDASCSSVASVTVTEPTLLEISSFITTDVNCNGGADGAIDITVSGGTGAYTYSWANGATTEDLTGLTAGSYSGTVTDVNGCTDASTITVTEPTALAGSATQTDITCNGNADGSASASISGGTPPYAYSWTGGQTTMVATGLTAGSYMVTVVDDNGCTFVPNTVTVSEPSAISAGVTVTDASTAGGADGAVDLAPAGGTAPYSFEWSNGATTEDLTGVAAGTYTVTITDANGCEHTASGTVLDGPSSVTVNSKDIQVNLFPNPAKEQATLSINLNSISDVNVQVINVTGQVLSSVNAADVINTQFELNMTDWAAGVYFVRITAGTETATYRLIKQ